MSKALITGINGQDGAYLTAFLKNKGYDVVGIMRKKEPKPNLDYTLKGYSQPKFYYGDVSEQEFISHVISTERPQEIYNLAAQSHVGYSFNNPTTTMQVNYGGLVNLIGAIKTFKVDAKVYQAGTSEMFGNSGVSKQNENTPFNPESPYAISKVAAHQAALNARKEGYWVSNGILFNHESPIRGEDFVTRKISLAVARIASGKQDGLALGNVSSRRDWGYAGDFVEGMWKVLQHDKPDDFVLATGETHSVNDFLIAAQDAAGLGSVRFVTNTPTDLRPNDLNYLCGDYTKAKELLGWEPKVRFKQLVEMMVSEDLRRV
jgi:GDPmannose 4,6-dehydratase